MIGGFIEKLTHVALYCLCFFLPLAYAPWGTDLLEGPKQLVLVTLVGVMFVGWLGSIFLKKKLVLHTSWFSWIILLFAVSVAVSAVLSPAPYVSWIGYVGQEYGSAVTLLLACLAAYVASQLVHKAKVLSGALLAVIGSTVVLLTVTVLTIFEVFNVPFVSPDTSFSLVSSHYGAAALALAVSVFGMGYMTLTPEGRARVFHHSGQRKLATLSFGLIWALTALLLLTLDLSHLWIVLIVGSVAVVLMSFIRSRQSRVGVRGVVLPLVGVVLAVIMLFVSTPIKANTPVAVSISQVTAKMIVSETFSEGLGNTLFGSGPNTYAFLYDKYKPQEVNQTSFWSIRFDRAKSFIWTILPTFGLLPTIAFVLMGLGLFVLWLRNIVRTKESSAADIIGLLWITLFSWHLLYSTSVTLIALLFVISGILLGLVVGRTKEIDLEKNSAVRVVSVLHLVVICGIILLGSAFYFIGKKHVADIYFAKGWAVARSAGAPEDVFIEFSKAVSWNSYQEFFLHTLAQAEISYAHTLLDSTDQSSADERTKKAYGLVQSAVSATKRTTTLVPVNSQNWASLGAVYRELLFSATNAEDYIAAAYAEAARLAPQNPAHPTDLAKLHLVIVNQANTLLESSDEDVKKEATDAKELSTKLAGEYIEQALAIKTDYAPARYYLATVHELRGETDQAIEALNSVLVQQPNDVGVAFEIGLLQLQKKDWQKAANQFNQILKVSPDFSNALWFLATAYENLGRTEDAIKTIENVARLNPNMTVVSDRLARLKRGIGPEPIPEPIPEEPVVPDISAAGEETTISPGV